MDKQQRLEAVEQLSEQLKKIRQQTDEIRTQLENRTETLTKDEADKLIEIQKLHRQQLIEIGRVGEQIANDEPIIAGAIKKLTDKIESELDSTQLDEAPELDGEVPDPLEQTRQVFEEIERKHKRGHAQVLEQMLPHLEKSMHREYNEVDKSTAELIGIQILEASELDDGASMVLPVEVSHLKTIDNNELHELLTHDEAPKHLAEVFTSPYLGLIVWGNATKVDDDGEPEPDEPKQTAKTLLIVHPLGLDQYTRLHDGTAWSEPHHTKLVDATLDDQEIMEATRQLVEGEFGRMPAMFAYFYQEHRQALRSE
jgi:hypothetical protein